MIVMTWMQKHCIAVTEIKTGGYEVGGASDAELKNKEWDAREGR